MTPDPFSGVGCGAGGFASCRACYVDAYNSILAECPEQPSPSPPLPSPPPPSLPPSPPSPSPPSPPPPSPSPSPSPPAMSVVGFALELAGDVSSFTPSVQAEISSAIAAQAGVDPSAVELTITPGSVIVGVSIQTYAATAASVRSAMASATSSPSSATAMLASVTGVPTTVLAVVTPPTVADVPPPPPPSPLPPLPVSAMSSGAFGVETSGSMGVIIGVVVGVIIALALALVIMHRRRREMRRKKAHEPPPLQRPTTEAHEPQPAVATAAPELNPELTPAAPEKRPITLEISSAEPAVKTESQSALVPSLPDFKLPIATAAPNPTVGQRYAVGSSVYVKRSHGEETLAYVKEYDVEKALYSVELEKVGSGKAKTYCDKDLRASKNMLDGLLYSVRANLFNLQAAQEPEPAEEAAQAVEAARAAAEEAAQAEAARVAAEEAAQAAEADRVQVLEPNGPPTAVRTVDELRNRRSTFIFPHYAVPATTFTNVNDVTRGQKVRL